MANADGRLFNVDRWTIYTLQRLYPNKRSNQAYKSWRGYHLDTLTPKQYRRMKKKMNKNEDYSIGLYTPAMLNQYPKSQRDNVMRY
jgi:hypothetical protein